jgi:hypothetical protein
MARPRSVSSNACCTICGYRPRRLITDGLRSYGVAQRAVLPDVRHRTSRYLNNRAETRTGPRDGASGNATLQVARASAAVPLRSQYDLRTLPAAAASSDRCRLPARACQGVPGLAAGDVRAVVPRIVSRTDQTPDAFLRPLTCQCPCAVRSGRSLMAVDRHSGQRIPLIPRRGRERSHHGRRSPAGWRPADRTTERCSTPCVRFGGTSRQDRKYLPNRPASTAVD